MGEAGGKGKGGGGWSGRSLIGGARIKSARHQLQAGEGFGGEADRFGAVPHAWHSTLFCVKF
jgi:hypothetical protein